MDGWLRIGTKVETKTFDKQIKELERKAEELSKNLEGDSKMKASLKLSSEDRQKLEADLERIKNQIISLHEKAKQPLEVKNAEESSKSFEKASKSIKKFALSLISIRGIYSLLSKASQSYMATDEKTTNQMEANWVGLGTIMKPAIDLIVGLMKKAVTSVLYFMSVLTGVNYIEKANTAILKKQTQATNELTKANDKLTTSFDEMNILKSNSNDTANSGVDKDSLFDVTDIGNDARKVIEKIGKALQPVYEKIKDIIDWSLDHPEAILGILGGATLLATISKIIGFAGSGTTVGTGLAGIWGILLGIASIGIITVEIKAIYTSVKEAQKTFKTTESMSASLRESNKKLVKSYIENKEAIDFTTESGKKLIDSYFQMAKNSIEQTDANYKEKESWGLLETIVNGMIGATENLTDTYYTNIDSTYAQIQILSDLYEQGLLNEDQTKTYIEIMKRFKEQTEITKGPVGDLTDEFWLNSEQVKVLKERYKEIDEKLKNVSESTIDGKNKTKDLNKEIDNLPNKKTVDIDVKTENATRKTKGWLSSLINDGIFAPINQLSKNLGFNFKIPYLATGGIINNPGIGVPLGMARGGEAGAEGVIPLTDSQAMETLGQAIGKHVNIALTNITKLDNRQLAREQKKINAQNNFAMNR